MRFSLLSHLLTLLHWWACEASCRKTAAVFSMQMLSRVDYKLGIACMRSTSHMETPAQSIRMPAVSVSPEFSKLGDQPDLRVFFITEWLRVNFEYCLVHPEVFFSSCEFAQWLWRCSYAHDHCLFISLVTSFAFRTVESITLHHLFPCLISGWCFCIFCLPWPMRSEQL